MSETTPVLGLQLTAAGQSQKHVTVNEALLKLDALVHLAVIERNRNAPPPSPANGDRYLVGSTPSGAFAGRAGQVASFDAGVWSFLAPRRGWRAYVQAENALLVYDGVAWAGFSPTGPIQNAALLGLGTTADAANPLSVRVNNALFTAASTPGGTGDLRFKLNKDAAANTVSQLYQTAFSGRAETGLMGNDRFGVKVSADGTNWRQALDIDPATGVVHAPFGLIGDRHAFRNRLVNGAFRINQRGVSGTVTLAAGAFGHDRWKAGAAGCAYTFATAGGVTTLTITAGSLCQIIEGDDRIDGTAFTLSWVGTATGRLWQGAASGAYGASPVVRTGLTPAVDTAVEFTGGTLTLAQCEPGLIATAFERRPDTLEAALCQRYFCKTYAMATAPGTATSAGYRYLAFPSSGGQQLAAPWVFPVPMRASPTVTLFSPTSGASGFVDKGATAVAAFTVGTCPVSTVAGTNDSSTSGNFSFHAIASAEL